MTPNASPLDWEPETEEDYEVVQSYLKEQFAYWCAANGTIIEADAGEAPIHYKFHYVDGHLTRWSIDDLDEIYLELHPAKMIVEDDELDSVLAEARAFITFLAETDLLDPQSDRPDVLLGHLERIEEGFVRNMGDVARYSPGKRFVMAAMANGVDLDDHDALQLFMADFNARKREREAVLVRRSHTESDPKLSGRVTAPGTRPRPKQPTRRRTRR
jgi:hypothetical protein